VVTGARQQRGRRLHSAPVPTFSNKAPEVIFFLASYPHVCLPPHVSNGGVRYPRRCTAKGLRGLVHNAWWRSLKQDKAFSQGQKKAIQGSSTMVHTSTTTYVCAFFMDEVGTKCVMHDRIEASHKQSRIIPKSTEMGNV